MIPPSPDELPGRLPGQTHCAFYRFTRLKDPEQVASVLRDLLARAPLQSLGGSILLATVTHAASISADGVIGALASARYYYLRGIGRTFHDQGWDHALAFLLLAGVLLVGTLGRLGLPEEDDGEAEPARDIAPGGDADRVGVGAATDTPPSTPPR